jgi:hypothetical protein
MTINAQSAPPYIHEFEQFVSSINSETANSNAFSDNPGDIVHDVFGQFDEAANASEPTPRRRSGGITPQGICPAPFSP